MGKTLHERVRLKGRYALFSFSRLRMAALGVTTILALAVVAMQMFF
ncbi:MAG TPA: hypothetical protein VJ698_10760 [Noviherbaspirillum sp.]|nr:hypothetical protein [Noviherbaspirillum sp.]HJV85946.1 hypothetical protein [Noviherbaspirillum sp.]